MYSKITALGLMFLLALSSATIGFADTKAPQSKSSVNQLAGMLPASDMVVAFDSDRFINEALPQILVSNQTAYNQIIAKIDEMQKKTGMDIRQLDQMVVGLAANPAVKDRVDFDPLMLARGKFNSDALVAVVSLMSEGKFRQELIANRTVYIFSPMKIDAKDIFKNDNMLSQIVDMFLSGIDREMALTAYDGNTLAIGATERVRDLLEQKTRISDEVLAGVSQNPKAIVSLAARMPEGFNQFVDLGTDNLGKTLSGVRFLTGSMDMTEGDASIKLNAKMENQEVAVAMKDTLLGLQMVSGAFIGGGKSKDRSILARTVKNIKIVRTGTQVSMAVTVPQTDIATLVAQK